MDLLPPCICKPPLQTLTNNSGPWRNSPLREAPRPADTGQKKIKAEWNFPHKKGMKHFTVLSCKMPKFY